MATKSSSVVVPVAPSAAACLTAAGSVAKATTWCPPFSSRLAMLPPMRPNPIMPICIAVS